MDRDKLAELRKKKAENKAKLHKELLDSNASIKDAIEALRIAIDSQEPVDLDKFIQEFKDSQTYGEDIKRFETALRESSDKEKLDDIIKAVGNINNTDVVTAVNNLIGKIEDKAVDQKPEAFQPVRRVRKIGQRLVFDDDPLQVNVSSGGGGGGVQTTLIRNNNSLAVVNPDGSPITDKFNFNELGQLEVDANFSGDIEIGDVQIKNVEGNIVNPATSENQINGSQKTQVVNDLINFEFDSVYADYPDTVTEVYTYKLDGDTVGTITIIYNAADKKELVSCIRS